MAGEPIALVEAGIKSIVSFLRSDPHSLETVYLSIITFHYKAKQVVPLTEVSQFQAPPLVLGSGTALGSALEMMEQCLKTEVAKTTPEMKGDYRPFVFILTDGEPTDVWEPIADRVKTNISGKRAHVIAVACGEDANCTSLRRITDEVLVAQDTSAESYGRLFKWVTASVATASKSVEQETRGVPGIELLPKDYLKKLEPGDLAGPRPVAERFIFLHARCAQNKGLYILRFGKMEGTYRIAGLGDRQVYRGISAHRVDQFEFEQCQASPPVSTGQLIEFPPCPYCESKCVATCACGGIHCCRETNESTMTLSCPWCGKTGVYKSAEGSIDVGRGLG
jgi:uncharacterized protein YegL